MKVRMVIEYALAALLVFFALLTVVQPQWIEAVFRVDPDRGSGALEWLIVVALGVVALLFAALGTRDVLRLRKLAA